MAVAAMANGIPKLCCSHSSNKFLLKPYKNKPMASPKFFLNTQHPNSNATLRSPSPNSPIRATNSPIEEDDSTSKSNNLIPQDDLEYLVKLGAGSIAAAIVIKYGSVIFPEITTPNLSVALIMVSTPVILAILLLISQTLSK